MLRTLRILFSNRKTSMHPAIWPRREDLGKADLKARAGVPERAREPDLGYRTQKETQQSPRTFADSGSEASLAAIRARVDDVDWTEVHADLDAQDDLPKRGDAIFCSGLYRHHQFRFWTPARARASASICCRSVRVCVMQPLHLRAVNIRSTILLLGDLRELGHGELRAQAVVAAEAHDHRLPLVRVDPVRLAFDQQRRDDVDALDPHFQRNDALKGAFSTPLVLSIVVFVRHHGIDAHEFGFELDWALQDTGRGDGLRRHGREASDPELVGMVPVAAQGLAGGYGVRTGQPGEAVDRVHLVHRREVQYALAGTDNIVGCLRDRLKAEHATPPQPERRRHRREIR